MGSVLVQIPVCFISIVIYCILGLLIRSFISTVCNLCFKVYENLETLLESGIATSTQCLYIVNWSLFCTQSVTRIFYKVTMSSSGQALPHIDITKSQKSHHIIQIPSISNTYLCLVKALQRLLATLPPDAPLFANLHHPHSQILDTHIRNSQTQSSANTRF